MRSLGLQFEQCCCRLFAIVPQGVLKALNVNKLTKCGVTFKFW